MQKKEIQTFCPKNQAEWREWLQKNHVSEQSVWLVYYKKKSGLSSLSWSQAVDEALCFGWIDSTARPIDDEKYMQFFSKRKATSVWSKVNKEKVKRLLDAKLIAPAGLTIIEIAKQNGSWTILDEIEELIIPKDLEKEFKTKKGSKDFFLSLSNSVKKAILQWLVLAKRPETRQKRITEIVDLASKKMKPKQF
ncbi:MAG: YdeI/OmpD-associated family protein [Bacteroidota bacterium]|nr:YdeI/OmpD-associated family protein [Bacteroidota bacterium]